MGGKAEGIEGRQQIRLGAQVQTTDVQHGDVIIRELPTASPLGAMGCLLGCRHIEGLALHPKGQHEQLGLLNAAGGEMLTQPVGLIVKQPLHHGLDRLALADLGVPGIGLPEKWKIASAAVDLSC